MPKRARLRMAGPTEAGQKLCLCGHYPPEQLRAGPLTLSVTVNGATLPPTTLASGGDFEMAFPLPDSPVGQAAIAIVVEVRRTFCPGPDIRDLGLAFGAFECVRPARNGPVNTGRKAAKPSDGRLRMVHGLLRPTALCTAKRRFASTFT